MDYSRQVPFEPKRGGKGSGNLKPFINEERQVMFMNQDA